MSLPADDTNQSLLITSGGAGETPAWSSPDIVMSAPAGIALLTPQSASLNAGSTTSITAGQDINWLAQANAGYSVKGGISLFTYGKASNPKKPNKETGISLHAASGKVSSQSQSDKTQITADKAITVASTTDGVQIQAKEHVLLTAQGAYIKMSGGNIEVHAPGRVDFKANMKSWAGAKSSRMAPLNFGKTNLTWRQHYLRYQASGVDGAPIKGARYLILSENGEVLATDRTDSQGRTQKITTDVAERVQIFLQDSEHQGFRIQPQET